MAMRHKDVLKLQLIQLNRLKKSKDLSGTPYKTLGLEVVEQDINIVLAVLNTDYDWVTQHVVMFKPTYDEVIYTFVRLNTSDSRFTGIPHGLRYYFLCEFIDGREYTC